MLMGTVVVHHQVQCQFGREFRIQTFQEFEKLLMSMPSETLSDHLTLSHFKRCKDRCGAIGFVVMGHRSTTALFQRQSRLRAIQCLNLTLLAHTEHQRFLWGIQIETHNIGEFLQKPWITRQLKCLCSVRLKTMTLPDPVDLCLAYAMLLAIFLSC